MKRRVWKVVVGVVAAILLVAGGLVMDAHRRAAAVIQRERAVVDGSIASFRGRDCSRPSVSKESIDGNAWDYYGPAVTALAAIPEELQDLVTGGSDADDDTVFDDHAIHSILREHQRELDRLQEGLRCRTVELRFEFDPKIPFPYPAEVMRVRRLLAGFAAHQHRMGDDAAAFRTAVTGFALAQDYGRTGLLLTSMIQLACEIEMREVLKPMFRDHSFSAEALREFAESMDRLDATRPDVLDCLRGEETFERAALIHQAWEDFFTRVSGAKGASIRPHWRALYSERITRAQALALLSERFRSLEGLKPLPAWQRIAPAKVIDAGMYPGGDYHGSGNVLMDASAVSFSHLLRRDAIAQLDRTLLRASIALARFETDRGRPPKSMEELVPNYLSKPPICPLTGMPLRTKDGGVWSLGENRADDGGVEPSSPDDGGGDGDVVWTVKRRK